jgi:hypothetical protein
MDFKNPVFDIASFELNQTLEANPDPYSPIEIKTIQGRLLNYKERSTFLAGLMIVKH